MLIDGIYLDGITSKRHKACLQVNSAYKITHIRITSQEQEQERVLSFEGQHYAIESRLGHTPREISFDDGQLFICEDFAEIGQLTFWQTSSSSHHKSWLYHLENNLKLICLSTVLTAMVVYVLIAFGIPAAAKTMAHNVPAFISEEFVSSLDVLDKTVLNPSALTSKRQQEIRQLAAPYLLSHADLNPKLVFRSGLQANALALPNGVIVFTDDFVNLTQSSDELVAILFHELGHLKHRHMTQRLLQDAMLTIAVVFVTGDVEAFDIVTGIPTLLLDLAYSRKFEIEADSYALSSLDKHNIPVHSFADAMKNLENYYIKENDGKSSGSLSGFFSTHPPTQERIQLVIDFNKP